MKVKTLTIFIVVTAVLLAAALAVSTAGPTRNLDAKVGTKVFPDLAQRLDRDEIAKITVTNATRTLTIERKGEDWVFDEKDGYPARFARVRETLIGLANLEYYEPKTQDPALFKRLELDELTADKSQSRLLRLFDKDGNTILELMVGKGRYDLPAPRAEGAYMRRPGDNETWLARGQLAVIEDAQRWLDRQIVDIASSRIKRVAIRHPDGEQVVLTKNQPADPFVLSNPPKGKKLQPGWAVDVVASALTGLELEDVRKAEAVPFAGAPIWKIDFESFEGLKISVEMADLRTEYWARFQASAEAGNEDTAKEAARINARTGGWAYRLVSYKATPLKTRTAEIVADANAPARPEHGGFMGGAPARNPGMPGLFEH